MFQSFDAPPEHATDLARARIARLRAVMRRAGADAFLVPRADAHQGEYVAPCDERLAWLTGFTGSAGMAIITQERAALIVDGRYTLQARNQVPTDLIETDAHGPNALEGWIGDALTDGQRVAFDPWLVTVAQLTRLKSSLKPKGIVVRPTGGKNLVDRIWDERPAPPDGVLMPHSLKYAGRNVSQKLAGIEAELGELGADAAVLTQPDSIAWLLNVRGNDVAHTPIARAFAIIRRGSPVAVFTETGQASAALRRHLGARATVVPMAELPDHLSALKADAVATLIDPATTPVAIARRLTARQLVKRRDPCILAKAVKNATEIAGARAAHVRDGAAVVRFLSWLDGAIENGEQLTEIEAAQRLEAFRADTKALQEISFDTISASGPHGAIVHYRVTQTSDRPLNKGELFLLDSGGQYLDGTTDITRTIAIGGPTKEMRTRATLVLKGHIAIARARFPDGTRGVDLDPLARQFLNRAGLDYGHGTGHGVGSFLSVHEGPQSISKRGMEPLQPGMIVSNEPGYYKEQGYGIRIENLLLVHPSDVPAGGETAMLGFETLTLAPFDRRLVDAALLDDSEREWLNAYHARVQSALGPELDRDQRQWLKAACAKI